MRNHRHILSPILVPALLLTLFSTSAPAFPKAAAPADAKAAATQGAEAAPTVPTITKGTVVETMDSGGYTYLCIENEGQKRWAAMPKADVKVGQQVELAPGMEMGRYTSKTLNRTFDAIYFCNGLASAPGELPHPVPEQGVPAKPSATGMPPGHGMPAGMPPGHGSPPAVKGNQPPAATIAGTVTETFDAGGYTYVSVAKDGQNTWVAAPPIKVAVGQEVAFKSGFVMKNFTSKSLDRTFDSIVFSIGLATEPPAPEPPGSGN